MRDGFYIPFEQLEYLWVSRVTFPVGDGELLFYALLHVGVGSKKIGEVHARVPTEEPAIVKDLVMGHHRDLAHVNEIRSPDHVVVLMTISTPELAKSAAVRETVSTHIDKRVNELPHFGVSRVGFRIPEHVA